MRDRILKAARGEPTDTTPIWIMRQAGRYLPEYRELRKKHSMEEICRTPALTVEVTLQPLRRFDLDAAILFSDLLVPLWGMGVSFDLVEGKGPVLRKPLTPGELAALPSLDLDALDFTFEAIRRLRRELDRPLIGFTGGPFTFASYLIERKPSRDYPKTRAFLHAQHREWEALMKRLADNLALYLKAQIEAFVKYYNHQRYHESLKNLTPADVYFNRGQIILLEREKIKRKTIQNRRLQHRKSAA